MARMYLPNPKSIVQLPAIDRFSQSGVYFLIYEDKVVYVGKARNMRRRIGQHMTEGLKLFDSVDCFPCSEVRLDYFEQRYIRRFVPKHNKCCTANTERMYRRLSPSGCGVHSPAAIKPVRRKRQAPVPEVSAA